MGKKYPCTECDRVFTSAEELAQHVRTMHPLGGSKHRLVTEAERDGDPPTS